MEIKKIVAKIYVMKKIPELLAPAGTLDAFKTAILYGADAIYAGLPGFSMRARAKITVEEVKQGIDFAHEHGKKVYLAFNLFAHDRDYENMGRVSEVLNYLRPDALIISDAGVLMWVKEHHPDIPIHISTQANICSASTVKFWQKAGAVQCVLAREVSHSEFESIRKQCPDIGLEIFIHGAMCMSYSGRCLLSNYITGRPSNRGACAQLCRWKYDVILRERESGIEMPIEEDDRGAYIMNSKDLCLMPRLKEVIESQPDTLKIEGRNRSEYYVGSVTRAYRNALDAYAADPEHFNPAPFMDDLNVLETRGYTTAFFDGPLPSDAHDYETTHSNSDWHAAGVITNVDSKNITLELRNEIKAGDTINFILPYTTDKVSIVLDKIINAKDGTELPKMSAGQKNSLLVPIEKIPEQYRDKMVPLILAYKHK
ncbi:MAG: U32 family peptidase C-terminal domain-containing protein [Alphaproteobacteria bacterium]|nr:U32 family peptidase C-terminal domain-containing protein [Alphaproteobacteria bacterium]